MASIIAIYADGLQRLLAGKRFLMLVGVTTASLATLAFLSESFTYTVQEVLSISVQRTSLLLLLTSFVAFSLLYLQSGSTSAASAELEVSEKFDGIQRDIATRLAALEDSSREMRNLLDLANGGAALSLNDKQEILNAVVEHTSEATIESLFDKKFKIIEDDIKRGLILENLTSSSRQLVARLRREIADLRLRSNINLIIGMSITLGGLYLLWSTIAIVDSSQLLKTLAGEGTESNAKFIKNLTLPILPRILLVVFIEVLAYFFLRLYRSGLSEIKFFQNELTNVESKLVAVEFAYAMQNQESLKFALDYLSKTERNFILEKGQTTVDLERAKSESDLIRSIVKTLPSVFKSARSK